MMHEKNHVMIPKISTEAHLFQDIYTLYHFNIYIYIYSKYATNLYLTRSLGLGHFSALNGGKTMIRPFRPTLT